MHLVVAAAVDTLQGRQQVAGQVVVWPVYQVVQCQQALMGKVTLVETEQVGAVVVEAVTSLPDNRLQAIPVVTEEPELTSLLDLESAAVVAGPEGQLLRVGLLLPRRRYHRHE